MTKDFIKYVDIVTDDHEEFEQQVKLAKRRGLIVEYNEGEWRLTNSLGTLLGAWHRDSSDGWLKYIHLKDED